MHNLLNANDDISSVEYESNEEDAKNDPLLAELICGPPRRKSTSKIYDYVPSDTNDGDTLSKHFPNLNSISATTNPVPTKPKPVEIARKRSKSVVAPPTAPKKATGIVRASSLSLTTEEVEGHVTSAGVNVEIKKELNHTHEASLMSGLNSIDINHGNKETNSNGLGEDDLVQPSRKMSHKEIIKSLNEAHPGFDGSSTNNTIEVESNCNRPDHISNIKIEESLHANDEAEILQPKPRSRKEIIESLSKAHPGFDSSINVINKQIDLEHEKQASLNKEVKCKDNSIDQPPPSLEDKSLLPSPIEIIRDTEAMTENIRDHDDKEANRKQSPSQMDLHGEIMESLHEIHPEFQTFSSKMDKNTSEDQFVEEEQNDLKPRSKSLTYSENQPPTVLPKRSKVVVRKLSESTVDFELKESSTATAKEKIRKSSCELLEIKKLALAANDEIMPPTVARKVSVPTLHSNSQLHSESKKCKEIINKFYQPNLQACSSPTTPPAETKQTAEKEIDIKSNDLESFSGDQSCLKKESYEQDPQTEDAVNTGLDKGLDIVAPLEPLDSNVWTDLELLETEFKVIRTNTNVGVHVESNTTKVRGNLYCMQHNFVRICLKSGKT